MFEYVLIGVAIAVNIGGLVYNIVRFVESARKAPIYDNLHAECQCENCKWFKPYEKVEDFDGFCLARECETDKKEFCSYAGRKKNDE